MFSTSEEYSGFLCEECQGTPLSELCCLTQKTKTFLPERSDDFGRNLTFIVMSRRLILKHLYDF